MCDAHQQNASASGNAGHFHGRSRRVGPLIEEAPIDGIHLRVALHVCEVHVAADHVAMVQARLPKNLAHPLHGSAGLVRDRSTGVGWQDSAQIERAPSQDALGRPIVRQQGLTL